MAKFGLMVGSGEQVLKEFEGDFLQVNGENVLIFAHDGQGNDEAVHVIRMVPGWIVKKMGK